MKVPLVTTNRESRSITTNLPVDRAARVTVKSYHDYQSTDEYRDIYLDDNGVTQLLVYEGPIGYDESRK